jgi:hypothetical protein
MPTIPDCDDRTGRQIATLVEFMDRVPLFQPVAPDDSDERRLWRARELCAIQVITLLSTIFYSIVQDRRGVCRLRESGAGSCELLQDHYR